LSAFIIYNTFSIIVARGAERCCCGRSERAPSGDAPVTAEALLVDSCRRSSGSRSAFVAVGLQALLSAFGFSLPTKAPVILPRTIVLALVVGTVVTYVSAISRVARRWHRWPRCATPVVLGGGNRRYRIGGLLLAIGLLPLGLGLFAGIGSDTFLAVQLDRRARRRAGVHRRGHGESVGAPGVALPGLARPASADVGVLARTRCATRCTATTAAR
jgi:putative ABC transport system permease protein